MCLLALGTRFGIEFGTEFGATGTRPHVASFGQMARRDCEAARRGGPARRGGEVAWRGAPKRCAPGSPCGRLAD